MTGDLPIRVGIVMEAHAVRQLYRIQLGSSVSPVWAVPAGTRSIAGDLATSTQTYSVGDLVIVCGDRLSPLNENGADALYYAIILCAVPHNVTGLAEDVERASEDTTDAKYEAADIAAYEHTDPIETRGFNTSERSCARLGEASLRSKHASIVVSGRKASISAGSAELSVNDIGDHWKFTGISLNCTLAGYKESHKVVNDSYLCTRVNYSLTDSAFPYFIEQTGELPYGNIRSVISKDGTALSNIEQRGDGSVVIQAASGISLERKLAVDPVYVDEYSGGICADSEVEDSNFGTEFEHCEPFARVANSKKWQALHGQTASDGFLSAQEPPKKIDTVAVQDINGNKAKPVSEVESVVRQLSDGSIVIRDAWGSEIRMYNGDIQFYAAKKMILMADSDILTMCGGAASLTAGAVNVSTEFGNIDMASAREFNVSANKGINVAGVEDLRIAIDGNAILSADDLALFVDCVSLEGAGTVAVAANIVEVSADADLAVRAGDNVVVDMSASGSISVAASVTNAYTTLRVTDATYTAGDVADCSTKPIKGAGALLVRGDCMVNGVIAAKSNIVSTTGNVAGVSVCAKSVAPEVGVYGIKELPKISIGKDDVTRPRQEDSETIEKLAESTRNLTMGELIEKLFVCVPKALSIILPKQCKTKTGNRALATGAHRIESKKASRYIYPGKAFWEGDVVYSADEDTDEVILTEKARINKIATTVKESDYVGK